MELQNHTPFPARLFRTAIDDDRIAASMVTKITYDLRGTELSPSEEQPWILSAEPWESEYGLIDTDQLFYRGGVDLFLFGHARPEKRDTKSFTLSVHVGTAWKREVAVFGVRVWRKGVGGLLPTAPLPIDTIPLTMGFAYGGKDAWDGLDIPYPMNPDGIGCYLWENSAEGKPLPNLEEPDQLITTWEDRPLPAGVGPLPPMSGIRLARLAGPAIKAHVAGKPNPMGEGDPIVFDATFFNAAHPRMIVPSIEPGTRIAISGVTGRGPLLVDLPDLRPRARVRFEDEVDERPLAIDQVGIEADKGRVFISYRFPFRYVVVPEQLREAHLFI
ncbi:DUF2169 family type VI secretion system accessory protein [Chondromyces crocatus]|uniref:DUF2169 domain-containing protein n=1 Tax=Chondromyces crocatus TaxID=52 RepID=A0A0K1EIE4_CHOCO|nr:DUF2169 domain-containing protein [Chondromyces crocatus]AKT40625.1 uncharacterized protein CMC5_047810 [Chondromyces crocatus]